MSRPLQPDARLLLAAEMARCDGLFADIGTDHGRLPAYMLENGLCGSALLCDISAPALDKARALFSQRRLSGDFRVFDGMPDAEAESVAVLGMGGDTIAHILRNGQTHFHGAKLTLSPQKDADTVRCAVMETGYHIIRECLVREGGRLYLLMQAVPGETVYSEKELFLGPCLMAEQPPLWRDYLAWTAGILEKIHTPLGETRLSWVKEYLNGGGMRQ